MFGYGQDAQGFPSRKNHKNSRQQPNSRSLRTDDIEGAKPRSGARRTQDAATYSGLNLPSYSKQVPKSPGVKQEEIIKNAANFFGSTPPVSPRIPQNSNESPPIDKNVLAKFYGATPPRSRARDPYSPDAPQATLLSHGQRPLPQAEVAKFYGVTPLQSRGFSYEPLERNQRNDVAEKNLAGFFGVTPQTTVVKANQVSVPPKELANFYGATPPRSRQPDPSSQLTSKPPKGYQSPTKYPSPPPVPNKASAAFFGASPPMSRQAVPSKDAAAFFGATPQGEFFQPKQDQHARLSEIEAAKFFGVTPQNTGYGPNNLRIPSQNFSPLGKNKPAVPDPEAAKFFGVTPDATGFKKENFLNSPETKAVQKTSGLTAKDLANFYGATPPPSRSPAKGPGSMQGYAQNIFSTGGKPANLSEKDLANFYGVTPPPSGRPAGIQRNEGGLSPRALANFYGTTPPPSGKANPGPSPNVFSDDAAKFFGSDSVAPEFQHAAEVATKPKFNPYARHKNMHENTAARIFN